MQGTNEYNYSSAHALQHKHASTCRVVTLDAGVSLMNTVVGRRVGALQKIVLGSLTENIIKDDGQVVTGAMEGKVIRQGI